MVKKVFEEQQKASMKYICPCEKHEVMESKHVHDFQSCSCGKCFVDGGDTYSRLGFPDEAFGWPKPIENKDEQK